MLNRRLATCGDPAFPLSESKNEYNASHVVQFDVAYQKSCILKSHSQRSAS